MSCKLATRWLELYREKVKHKLELLLSLTCTGLMVFSEPLEQDLQPPNRGHLADPEQLGDWNVKRHLIHTDGGRQLLHLVYRDFRVETQNNSLLPGSQRHLAPKIPLVIKLVMRCQIFPPSALAAKQATISGQRASLLQEYGASWIKISTVCKIHGASRKARATPHHKEQQGAMVAQARKRWTRRTRAGEGRLVCHLWSENRREGRENQTVAVFLFCPLAKKKYLD